VVSVVTVLELKQAAGKTRERIEDAAEHHIEHRENQDVEREPDNGERIQILPRLGDLVRRLADDDYRVHVVGGDQSHRAADQLQANQGREPARRLRRARAGALGRRRQQHRELAHDVHEQDADVAQMLEL
jgi:hypothetical protein